MHIEFDDAKRHRTLAERGLDFARAAEVFAGVNVTFSDDRADYGEPRFNTMRPSGWPHGGSGVDNARRGSSHHQHEESQ